MAGKKKDSVPKELVSKHVAEFCSKFPDTPVDNDGFMTPYEMLAERIGCDYSYIWKMKKGCLKWDVSFDMADRIFCAMGSPNLWHQDPDLHDIYEYVVAQADRLHPIDPLELAA